MNLRKNLLPLLALCAAMIAAPSAALAKGNSSHLWDKRGDKATAWADSVYNTLSERQRVAQLIFPKIVPTQGASSKTTIKTLIGKDGFGGILFTKGSLAQYAEMTNYAQSVAKVPVMMTFDGEWGLAMRIDGTPRFQYNMGLGAISDPRLLYRYGQEMARECKLMGIQVNFAPDADVNSNPANPVIGYRSFGENPARVSKASVAYSLGLEDGGVLSVAKHFPGHGDTDVDSHKALPAVNHSRAYLDSVDLVPFKDYIDSRLSGVMVGHISVPSLDPSGTPASLSHAVTTGLLRDKLGFNGLIFTDAIGMKGCVSPDGTNTSVAALLAGADVLLSPLSPEKDLNAIMAAIKSGKLSKKLIEERCKKVLAYKYLLGLNDVEKVETDPAKLSARLNSPEAEALLQEMAAASMTVLFNKDNILPLGSLDKRSIAVVNIGAHGNNNFATICHKYADTDTYFTMGEEFSAATLKKIKNHDVVIAAVYNDNASSRAVLSQLANSAPANLVGVFMTDPYKMKKFSSSFGAMKALVLVYDDTPHTRSCAAQALFGGIAVEGRLPVNLKGVAKEGAGVSLPKTRLGFSSPVAEGFKAALSDSIDAIVTEALAKNATPGCQVLVARHGNIVFDKSYGKTTAAPGGHKVTDQTIYDLASVSKATGTLPGIMKAYDSGLLSLDEKLGNIVPGIEDSAKREITVRELLFHETGMQAGLNMYDVMIDTTTYTGRLITGKPDKNHRIKIQNKVYGNNTARMRRDIASDRKSDLFPIEASRGIFVGPQTYDTVMSRIYKSPLRKDKSYNYSCLNFSILMDIEQRKTGKAHDKYVRDNIFAPLGAYNTGYRPLESHEASQIAPTEYDSFLRRQILQGYVHDELANFSGGVQGNAGLFSTADDLAKICQMWLNGGTYGDARVLSPETVKLFTETKSPTCRRGLGFDKPDKVNPDWSPTCDEANAEVFGHLGFTGTVFWVDPKEDMIFIFLTNRVNPTRDSYEFNKLNMRPRLFSQLYKAL